MDRERVSHVLSAQSLPRNRWLALSLSAAALVAVVLFTARGRAEAGSLGEKYQEQSLALFNPAYDLDSPTRARGGWHNLRQDMADALRGAKRGHAKLSHDDETQPEQLVLLDPNHDPDSPAAETRSQLYSRLPVVLSQQFASRLKLREQEEMLATRETLDASDAESDIRQRTKAASAAKKPHKLSIASLSDHLREGLASGDDPEVLMASVESQGRAYKRYNDARKSAGPE